MLKKFKDIYFTQKFNLDLYLSEIYYKNRVGFKLNREGLTRWKDNQKIYGKPPKKVFPLGYHLFAMSNKVVLQEVINKYNSIICNSEYTLILDKNGKSCSPELGSFFMLRNILDYIPEVLGLLTPDVLEILYSYYSANFKITHIAAYRTTNVTVSEDSKEVYAYRLHYDRHPVDTLKLFVTLSDVTKDDGALNFFDKKYSQTILKSGYKERDQYGRAKELIESDHNKIHLIGTPGTAAICNTTSCLHKAGIPAHGRTRDLLVFSFESASQPLELTKDLINQIKLQINNEYKYIGTN